MRKYASKTSIYELPIGNSPECITFYFIPNKPKYSFWTKVYFFVMGL